MERKAILGLVLVGGGIGGASVLSAQQFVPGDSMALLGPRSLGQAGSTAASELPNQDSLLQNPAAAAFTSDYTLGLSYSLLGDSLTAAVVDTQSGPIGGGLYYMRRDLRQGVFDNSLTGNYARVEDRAGVSLMMKTGAKVAIGGSFKYAYQRSYQNGVDNSKAFNGDFGVFMKANPKINLALVAQNLLNDETGLHPKKFILAGEYRFNTQLSANAQVFRNSQITDGDLRFNNDPTLSFSGGVQYLMNGFAIRGGYLEHRIYEQRVISAGLGYQGESFSLDYSFHNELEGSRSFHGFSFTGYL